MSSRRIISTFFIATAGLTIPLIYFHEFTVLVAFWVISDFLYFIPALVPNCGWFGPLITRFQTEKREVWLTIDDGPDPVDTPRILELLASHQAVATFFLIGERAIRYPELVREILRQGHTIGNHTFSHPIATFWMALPPRISREVDACREALAVTSDQRECVFFRAPVGMVNFFVAPALRKRNLNLIGWSARGFDSIHSDPQKIVSRIWKQVSPGVIILLHEGHHQNGEDKPVNPKCLELLLEKLTASGYTCVLPGKDQLICQ